MQKGILLIVTDSEIHSITNKDVSGGIFHDLSYSNGLSDLYHVIKVRGSEARAEILRDPVEGVGKGMVELTRVFDFIHALQVDHGNKIPSDKLVEELKVIHERG
jgi:hypothetical protein